MNYHISVIQTAKYCYVNAMTDTDERISKLCIDLDSEDANRYKKALGGKVAKVILVSTAESAVGKGVATALMKKAIEVLSDYNLYLNVIPLKRNERDKDKHELIDFYSKFGFEKYEGDISVTTMIRKAD